MRRWTAEEKTALVQQYVALPHGTKAAWLLEQGVSRHQIMTWRKAFYFGDLERDLVPRDTSHMTVADGARLARVEQELAAERTARAREAQTHAEQVARLEASNEALGKAIGLLHQMSEQEPAVNQPTNDPSDSSTPRTTSSDS